MFYCPESDSFLSDSAAPLLGLDINDTEAMMEKGFYKVYFELPKHRPPEDHNLSYDGPPVPDPDDKNVYVQRFYATPCLGYPVTLKDTQLCKIRDEKRNYGIAITDKFYIGTEQKELERLGSLVSGMPKGSKDRISYMMPSGRVTLTRDDLDAMLSLGNLYVVKCYQHELKIAERLRACRTPEEFNKIDMTLGWPEHNLVRVSKENSTKWLDTPEVERLLLRKCFSGE